MTAPTKAQERARKNEAAFAASESPALAKKRRDERQTARLAKKADKEAGPQVQPQALTGQQQIALATPIVEPEKPAALLNGLFRPEGRLEVVTCDLAGYVDPVRVLIWYRTNNKFAVAAYQSMLITSALTAPIREQLEHTRAHRAHVEELIQKTTEVLSAEEGSQQPEELKQLTTELEQATAELARLNEQYTEAAAAELLDYYKHLGSYVRRIWWNLDIPIPNPDDPGTFDALFNEANDLANWIARDGYEKAKRQVAGPNFTRP